MTDDVDTSHILEHARASFFFFFRQRQDRSSFIASDHRQWNMEMNTTGTFGSLNDALKFVGLTSGLFINETLVFRTANNRPTLSNSIPLILGIIGLIFNILALLIFTASKTFRQSSFRCYIYAFVLVNCASILT